MDSSPDLYAVLGLHPGADAVVVHAAWKALLRKHHPDVNHDEFAGFRTREINHAFAVLGKPDSRAAYDAVRRHRALPVPVTRVFPRRSVTPRPAAQRASPVALACGILLLTAICVPATSVVLLSYEPTAPILRGKIAGLAARSTLAARLVRRLDVLVPGFVTAPSLTPSPPPSLTPSPKRETPPATESAPPEIAVARR